MNPVLLDLGFFQLRYYSLMYVVALFLGLYLAKRDLKKTNINYSSEDFEAIALFSFLFGILGARFYYVIFNLSIYLPIKFFPFKNRVRCFRTVIQQIKSP